MIIKDWQNPNIIQKNKRSATASSPGFKDFAVLSKYISDKKTGYNSLAPMSWPNKKELNGQWKFKLYDKPDQVDQYFYSENYDVSGWDNIQVPGVWQLQGYHEIDKPYYLAFDYPPAIDKKKIPSIDDEQNTVGCYRRTFEIKGKQLKESHVFLHFGAVKSAFYLYINGVEVGYSQGSMTPAEFDVTPYLVEGTNTVATKVLRYSDGTYLEDQDMWFLSGMYRDVFLVFEPIVFIEDYYIQTLSHDDNWELRVKVCVRNSALIKQPLKVQIHLGDDFVCDGRLVVEPESREELVLSAKVDHPKLWSAEEPNLYPLIMSLRGARGDFVQVKQQLIGFRQITIENSVLKLNGKPITFHGVNRHEFHSTYGHAVPKETILQDLLEMKRLNINAVRTSHYPNSPYFYDLCDKLGFYVIDEADMETHGVRNKHVPGSKKLWTAAVVDRIQRMVLRDRNHPCIIMWSLGNEAGYGDNFLEMKKSAIELDATRPVHYEGDKNLKVSDVFSRMYAGPDFVHKTGNKQDLKVTFLQNLLNRLAQDNKSFKAEQYKDKPVMYCEFAHAMENSLGNFKEHIDAWYEYENWCGGFIWDYVDQSIRMEKDGQVQWLYGGDFGEEISHKYYNANGIVAGDRTLHPSAFEVKKVYQFVRVRSVELDKGLLEIENRYVFKNLKDFDWCYEILEDGAIIDEGKLDGISVEPLTTVDYQMFIPTFKREAGARYHLNFYFRLKADTEFEKAGYIQAVEQLDFPDTGNKIFIFDETKAMSVYDKKMVIEVISSEFSATIAKTTGDITSFRINDYEILRKQIKLNLWRAETDNDRGYSNFDHRLKYWSVKETYKKAMMNYRATGFKIDKSNGLINVSFVRKVKGFKNGIKTNYLFDGSGNVEISLEGIPNKEMVRFGTTMAVSKDWSEFMYYGKGPHENYVDRCYGAHMGIYSSNIDELMHHYMRPQENGNRCGVKWFMAESENQIGITIESTSPVDLQVSAWPYTQDELSEKEHIHELEKSEFVTLNIDGFQKGVGGDYPGLLSLLDKYKLPSKETYKYSFRIMRN